MKCSPIYYDKNNQIKNIERLEIDGACSEKCMHFEQCKKDLGLKKDWKFPVWIEKKATDEDIRLGLFHKKGDKYFRYFKTN